MKRIFSLQAINDNVAEVFHYDYHSALYDCMDHISGIWYSNGKTIDLSSKRPKDSILIPGWDLGDGNVLALPWKVCECVTRQCYDNYVVAYTVWKHYKLELVVVSIPKDKWENESLNGIDYITELFRMSDGFNSDLYMEEKLYWKRYSSASASSNYTSYEYDYTTDTLSITPETEHYRQKPTIEQSSFNSTRIVKLPKSGMSCIHISPLEQHCNSPAIIICPSGPYIPVPDIKTLPKLYNKLSERGYHVIIPLRRGIIGISNDWEQALIGNYGILDVTDIIDATKEIINDKLFNIDTQNVGLYGASYGGYSALLICGKHNHDTLFKSVVCHCGIFDIAEYPKHCSGEEIAIMMEYGNTTDYTQYIEKVKNINPANFINNWKAPVLLIHTLDDTATWFGQSVKAYNTAISKRKNNVSLIIAEGGHTYNINKEEIIYEEILHFFDSHLKSATK